MRWILAAVLVALAPGSLPSADPAGPPPAPAAPSAYLPPADAPVIDGFRPPTTPYGPGNRGLEYRTVAGTPVRSIGAGTVTFAGSVARRGVVSVEHPDGLRSSLTGLATVAVHVGDEVEGGSVLGTATTALHLGVRRDGAYIDPAGLFAVASRRPRHAVLVAVPG